MTVTWHGFSLTVSEDVLQCIIMLAFWLALCLMVWSLKPPNPPPNPPYSVFCASGYRRYQDVE